MPGKVNVKVIWPGSGNLNGNSPDIEGFSEITSFVSVANFSPIPERTKMKISKH